MKKNNQINEPEKEWPVTFEQVEDSHLRDMLKATPAQRLAMAEELLNFTKAKIVKT
mgnify:CR=1 FL=1